MIVQLLRWLLDKVAELSIAQDYVGRVFSPKVELCAHDSIWLVRSKFRRPIRLRKIGVIGIQNEPVCALYIARQARSGRVGRARVHFKKVSGRMQLGQHVVNERVAIDRSSQVSWTHKKTLT